jgi:hypothetical protein
MSSYVSTLAGDKHKKCHPIYMPRLPLVPPQLNSQQPSNGMRNGVAAEMLPISLEVLFERPLRR